MNINISRLILGILAIWSISCNCAAPKMTPAQIAISKIADPYVQDALNAIYQEFNAKFESLAKSQPSAATPMLYHAATTAYAHPSAASAYAQPSAASHAVPYKPASPRHGAVAITATAAPTAIATAMMPAPASVPVAISSEGQRLITELTTELAKEPKYFSPETGYIYDAKKLKTILEDLLSKINLLTSAEKRTFGDELLKILRAKGAKSDLQRIRTWWRYHIGSGNRPEVLHNFFENLIEAKVITRTEASEVDLINRSFL